MLLVLWLYFLLKPKNVVKDIDYIFSYLRFNISYDFYSLINSYERKLHYPSFFWIMNPRIVNKFLRVYSENYDVIINSKRKLIDVIEISFTNKIKDKYRCMSFYTVNNSYNKNIHFDDWWKNHDVLFEEETVQVISKIDSIKLVIRIELVNGRLPQLDPDLNNWLYSNAILTGGAIPSLLHDEEPNDWDLYIKDTQSIAAFSTHIMVENNQIEVKEINPKYMCDTEVKGKLITSHATTFKNNVQVITMGAADMRHTFDYVHCMPWYDIASNKLYISEYQYNIIMEKKLVRNPECKTSHNAYRTQKYIERGWSK